jgi:ammonium transporter
LLILFALVNVFPSDLRFDYPSERDTQTGSTLVIRTHYFSWLALALLSVIGLCSPSAAQKPELLPMPKETGVQTPPKPEEVKKGAEAPPKGEEEAKKSDDNTKKNPWDEAVGKAQESANKASGGVDEAKGKADTAWMLASSALVMLMLPGLALFYGGMVRRKNVLATMMQSYAALAVVGLYWIAFGYSLAFGPSLFTINEGGIVGWSWDLVFLKGVEIGDMLPNNGIPIYVHVMFQGMFAIVTPALISGAVAERIRFWPFCIFMLLWVTLVYCPLAHMVWAMDWFTIDPTDPTKTTLGTSAIGLIGKMGALDFAGGTVVHIAAGTAGLAAAMVLRKRTGYPEHAMHPNSMVLTLVGAGLLWFGWFGFNGGSATGSSTVAGSAFAATQAAAAAAGLSWMIVEWLIKGKPTALGLASGIVAGLVAVTPASGYVYMWGGAAIGFIAGIVCYFAVAMKSKCGYDDSLDAFGVHAVGGFLGAVLTGVFCYAAVNGGADGFFAMKGLQSRPEAIKKELEPLVKEIKEAKREKNEASLKAEEDKSTADKATGAAKVEATANATNSAALSDAAAAKLKRREDKQTKLRDEYAKLTGYDGVKKLIESGDAGKLGIAWTDEELSSLEGSDGTLKKYEADGKGSMTQVVIQFKAALISSLFAFGVSLLLVFVVHLGTGGNFTTSLKNETEGLDQTEHGEVGFDYGGAYDAIPTGAATEPKAAKVPPGGKRFAVIVEGVENGGLMKAWSDLCVPSEDPIDPDFKAVYPYVTTVQGNRFRLRGGDPATLSTHIQKLFQKKLGKPLKVRVEE